MEKQETRLIGVAHCIVPKEELIETTIHVTTPPSTVIGNILIETNSNVSDGIESVANTADTIVLSTTLPTTTSTTETSTSPQTIKLDTSTTETPTPPMTVAEVIIRRNETEFLKSINTENDSLPLTSNITETDDNVTINNNGNDVDDVGGIENDPLQDDAEQEEEKLIEKEEEKVELMIENEETLLSSDEYIMQTTTIPEKTSVNITSTSENSSSVLVTVPVSSTTSTPPSQPPPPTIKSTTITEVLLDKIEDISEAPEQENYVYEVMTLPQVLRPTDERAQNIVLEDAPPILPNDTAIAA